MKLITCLDDKNGLLFHCRRQSQDRGLRAFMKDMVKEYEDRIEELILFRWNKIYPADLYFDLDLSAWHLEETEEFEGSTHHITKKRYTKEKHHYETAK